MNKRKDLSKIQILADDCQQIDLIVLFQFIVFLCFSNTASVQVLSYLIFISYLIVDFFYIKKGKVAQIRWKTIWMAVSWFIVFTIWVCMSKLWAYGVKNPSYTVSQLIRMCVTFLLLSLYASDYNRAVRIVKSFVIATFIFGIVVMATTPPAYYGNEAYFGRNMYVHRNAIGAVMAEAAGLSWIMDEVDLLKYGKLYSVFMTVVLICSGSRGSIVELLVIILVLSIFEKNINKKIYILLAMSVVLVIGYFLVTRIPYLYEKIYLRMINMLTSVVNNDNSDSSAYSRGLRRSSAFEMFLRRPFLGYGLDGVSCYLAENPYYKGRRLSAVYSHCNYTELGADFGIFGLLFWYIPVIRSCLMTLKSVRVDKMQRVCFALLAAVVILDYGRIPWVNFPNMMSLFTIMIYICNSQKNGAKK